VVLFFLSLDRQRVAAECDLDVIFAHPRQFGLDHDHVFLLVHIDGWRAPCEGSMGQPPVPSKQTGQWTPPQIVHEPVHPLFKIIYPRGELTGFLGHERLVFCLGHSDSSFVKG
jgi:hypothetical protein